MENDAVQVVSGYDNNSPFSFTEFFTPFYVQRTLRNWPFVKSALEKHGLSATLDQAKRSITVSTTIKTKCQNILDRARGCIILLSKTAFGWTAAVSVLDGERYYDYIKIGFQEGGFAAVHGMKKEVYISKLKCLSEHIKEFGRLFGCTIQLCEDFIGVVGRTHTHVKNIREVARRCIVENTNPGIYVKKIDRRITKKRLARKLIETTINNEVVQVESINLGHDDSSSVEIASFTDSIKPFYVEKTLRDWLFVERALVKLGLSVTLDRTKRSITVSTTTRTKCQDILDRARGCIILLTKTTFSPTVAISVLYGERYYDYIEIGFQEGGLAAIHGMKKDVYISKVKSLSEHIKEFGEVSNSCKVSMREDFIAVVGKIKWSVDRMREIARKCIVENTNPEEYVKILDQRHRANILTSKLTELHI